TESHRPAGRSGTAATSRSRQQRLRRACCADRSRHGFGATGRGCMIDVLLVGNTQPQAARLKGFLEIEARILLDDETRSTRAAPLEVDAAVSIRFNEADIAAISCRLLQCSGAGTDGIALAALPKTTIVCVVHEHEIPIAEYVMLGILEHEIGMSKAVSSFD